MAASRFASLPGNLCQIIEEDQTVPFRARTSHIHRTWAGTYSSLPELYIQPQSLAEVEKAINLARRCRRRISTVGCGHSPSDITCTSSWLINLDNFNKVLAIDTRSCIVVMQAGIRIYQLTKTLDEFGLALPSLGSINEQSIAGAISTGTHGSSLQHGLVSESVVALKITLADGSTRACSPDENPDLFRASLLSLGAIGIITEVTLKVVPAFAMAWEQTIDKDTRIFEQWEKDLWSQSEFVRVWWFPYMRRAVVWKADKVEASALESGEVKLGDPPVRLYDNWLGYVVYHNLLAVSRWVPRILPWVEWFVFGMQYGFRNGDRTRVSAVQPSQKAFLLNCLYSQFVNEWAIPLHRGPEALQRLASWLHNLQPGDPGYVPHGIPYSSEGLWIHSPVEVRVSDTTVNTSAEQKNRPFLDPTPKDGPTLYLNALMYRPYHRDPRNKATERYFLGFEHLMRDLGGKPHWAKSFTVSQNEFSEWYGEDFTQWRKVRDSLDPSGMFVGPWHRRYLLGGTDSMPGETDASEKLLSLEEVGFIGEPETKGGGVRVRGHQNPN
ncbi:D-arabinono-1,4-lactone oxidase-domain-containing protein [Rhypophila decipiens]|uniref:D-arabinono-1,4-lactone oxidase n=1 Tax=Rhypophila decipiens TaxID=261697 RepID=A0AAN6YMS6_9PEZI|nr:D-arabinono-1,4-lactone oxidase-domain-containing protein [Rhypophila decipiens]